MREYEYPYLILGHGSWAPLAPLDLPLVLSTGQNARMFSHLHVCHPQLGTGPMEIWKALNNVRGHVVFRGVPEF